MLRNNFLLGGEDDDEDFFPNNLETEKADVRIKEFHGTKINYIKSIYRWTMENKCQSVW